MDNDYFNFKLIDDADSCVHGSHWDIFLNDMEKDFLNIIEHIKEAILIKESEFVQLPSKEPRGGLLAWPTEKSGVIYCIDIDENDDKSLASAYPIFEHGRNEIFRLDEVLIWENRLEACIRGSVSGVPVTFFDPYFTLNRHRYILEGQFNINLLGFAYFVELSNRPDIIIEGESLEKLGEIMQKSAVDGKVAININRAKIFINKTTAIDDYEFQGELLAIETIENPLTDIKLWLASVNIGNTADDEDFILNIIISENSLRSSIEFKVGMFITGAIWLQGYISE